jgi:protein-tyrosine phosphatase
MSVTGKFGRQIKKFTDHLLKKYYVDFIATDAHNIERRPPVISTAYQETSRIMGKHEADRIFLENPQAVINNTEIPV